MFNLEGVKLRITKRVKKSLDKNNNDGCYSREHKAICLGSKKRHRYNILVLLHEVKHALQDKRGSLDNYLRSWRDLWRMEKAADHFANKVYKKLYSKRHGRKRLHSHKKTYREFWKELLMEKALLMDNSVRHRTL